MEEAELSDGETGALLCAARQDVVVLFVLRGQLRSGRLSCYICNNALSHTSQKHHRISTLGRAGLMLEYAISRGKKINRGRTWLLHELLHSCYQ